MAKFRAKVDVAPSIKKGDIVEFEEPLVDGYKNHFEEYNGSEEAGDGVEEDGLIANPDRNALKARATELGVVFANNTPTDKLVELVKEAEEKKAAE